MTLCSLKPLTSSGPRVLGCRPGQFTPAPKPSAAQRPSSAGDDFCGQGVCLYTLLDALLALPEPRGPNGQPQLSGAAPWAPMTTSTLRHPSGHAKTVG